MALRDDILEGRTGFMCRPQDPQGIAPRGSAKYFDSLLYHDLDCSREGIREIAYKRHSWAKVAAISERVYRQVGVTS